MNRFTKDMATIDDMLPLVLFDLIQVRPTKLLQLQNALEPRPSQSVTSSPYLLPS